MGEVGGCMHLIHTHTHTHTQMCVCSNLPLIITVTIAEMELSSKITLMCPTKRTQTHHVCLAKCEGMRGLVLLVAQHLFAHGDKSNFSKEIPSLEFTGD